VFRAGGVSYLRIPAPDPELTASFYEAVFGWSLRGGGRSPGFSDASGHVIGHFVPDLPVAGAAGVMPYIYVEDLQDSIELLRSRGGEVVTAPYPEGDMRVARFRDPAGNVIGLWQRS